MDPVSALSNIWKAIQFGRGHFQKIQEDKKSADKTRARLNDVIGEVETILNALQLERGSKIGSMARVELDALLVAVEPASYLLARDVPPAKTMLGISWNSDQTKVYDQQCSEAIDRVEDKLEKLKYIMMHSPGGKNWQKIEQKDARHFWINSFPNDSDFEPVDVVYTNIIEWKTEDEARLSRDIAALEKELSQGKGSAYFSDAQKKRVEADRDNLKAQLKHSKDIQLHGSHIEDFLCLAWIEAHLVHHINFENPGGRVRKLLERSAHILTVDHSLTAGGLNKACLLLKDKLDNRADKENPLLIDHLKPASEQFLKLRIASIDLPAEVNFKDRNNVDFTFGLTTAKTLFYVKNGGNEIKFTETENLQINWKDSSIAKVGDGAIAKVGDGGGWWYVRHSPDVTSVLERVKLLALAAKSKGNLGELREYYR